MFLAMKQGGVLVFVLLCAMAPRYWAGASGSLCAAAEPQPALTPEQTAAVKALIAKLNDPDVLVCEKAEEDLVKFGPTALPLVREATGAAEPELAARAKRVVSRLAEVAARPGNSYAESMPGSSIFFLEAPHTRQTLDRMKGSPLGKFWDSPAMQKFYKGDYDAQAANDQKALDAVRAIPKLLDGKALLALGAPDTAEAAELDPPLVYVAESKQPVELEMQVRNLFQGLDDPPKGEQRPYGPFRIAEHISAQTVFGQERVVHALTQKGIESFLDCMVKRPAESLSPALKEIRALLPQYDFIFHIASNGFKELSDAAQLIDDEQVETMDKLGFICGSTCQGVVAVNADGFEEHLRMVLGGGDKNNDGLLAVIRKTAVQGAAPRPAGAPQALDLIPKQAGLLLSFQGDNSRAAAALAAAIRSLDERPAPAAPQQGPNAVPAHQPGPQAAPGAGPVPAPGKTQANALGQQALAEANPKGPGKPAPAKAAKPPVTHPMVERVEKIGLSLERFLEQVDGPVHFALFLEQVEEETPDDLPVSLLAALMLKDANVVSQALEASCGGATPRFTKEALGTGTFYKEKDGEPGLAPGFWLKGNYLAYAAERDLLDLAAAALLHREGNERLTDREGYKRAVAQKRLDPQALFTIFGDAEYVLEMPYGLARVLWQEDPKNPWPDWAVVKGFLEGKPVVVQFKATPDGIEGVAQTPLTLFGMIEAFRKPFIEAGYW